MEEELLGGTHTILLNGEKIKYTKSIAKENYVTLSMKPQAVGEIIITSSKYIDGLSKITPNDTLTEVTANIPNDTLTEVTANIPNDTLTEVTANIPNDYFIWLVLGGVLIIVVIVVIIIMRKIKK